MIDLILRTCENSQLENNVSQEHQRICGSNRSQMVFACVRSLVAAIQQCEMPAKLTVLDDRSSSDFLNQLSDIVSAVDHNIVHVQTPDGVASQNHSAHQQFLQAAHCENLVYTVEDDYLHDPDALNEMLQAYHYFGQRFPADEILIFPFDCPFRYEPGREQPAYLFHSGVRYWRTVSHTTYTIFGHAQTFYKHRDVFEKLALGYPQENEDSTINQLYKRALNPDAPVAVFNPIPSLAYHLSYAEPPQIASSATDWRQLWDTYQK